MSRWQAFGIHLSISAVILLLLLAVIMFVWFPGILFSVDGGWAGLRIVIGVDMVLGPLMTLVVYKAGKPGLKFDLTAIALFQFTCMAAGMWIVYNERPLALVLAHDTVYSITSQEFEDYDKDPGVLDEFPGSYPKLLYTEMPENDIAADIAAIRSQFIGDPLFIQTERYRVLPERNTAEIFRREESVRASVSEELLSQLVQNCVFAKFISAVTSGYVCFDTEQMRYVEYYENEYSQEPAAAEVVAGESSSAEDI
ncbi:MAG: hypothetical protein MI746_14100 [Pseudomonadales bacterium]|nr:hypothetical protein [Pseudomonadales bacterium]